MKTVCPHCHESSEIEAGTPPETMKCRVCGHDFAAAPSSPPEVPVKPPVVYALLNTIAGVVCVIAVFVIIAGIMIFRPMVVLIGLSLILNAIFIFAFARLGNDVSGICRHTELLEELVRRAAADKA